MTLESHKSHLPAFSSTKWNNRLCPLLPWDCRKAPTSSCTKDSSIKCPAQGIIIFKGFQFLSTRVALRHYVILKRLLDQQRISTAMVAAGTAALTERQGSILNSGTAQGLVLCPVTQGKGRQRFLCLRGFSQCCSAQCREHTRPGDPTAQSHRGPVCKLTGTTSSS